MSLHLLWNNDVRQTTTPFCYCPNMAFLSVWPHCMNARQNRFQEDINSFPLGELEKTTGTTSCGWWLSSRTWNPVTSPWMKQLTWFRIIHSGDWCLHLALSTS